MRLEGIHHVTAITGDAPSDVTGDGRVNVLDLQRVRGEMRRAGAMGAVSSVLPEPATLAPLCLAAAESTSNLIHSW